MGHYFAFFYCIQALKICIIYVDLILKILKIRFIRGLITGMVGLYVQSLQQKIRKPGTGKPWKAAFAMDFSGP